MKVGGVAWLGECYLLISRGSVKARAAHSVLVSSSVNYSVLDSSER